MEAKVRDAMSAEDVSVDAGHSLADAVEEMKRNGIRSMPVVGNGGEFAGVLVWRDAEEALQRGGNGRLTVADVCRKGLSVGLDESLQAAQAVLDAERVGRIPVVDGSKPVGVISRSHIRTFLEDQSARAAFEELRPPDELVHRYEDSADIFFETGRRGLASLRHLGLEPHHRILDPGCGAGRLAIALTQYLTPDGGYEGFDLFRDCIEWCAETITPRYPNFGFMHADIFYKLANDSGKVLAKDYTFPYDDEQFDFVVLISVFTHIQSDGFEQYLSEIARVLKSGGRVYATFFLLNDATLDVIEATQNPKQPLHDFGRYRVASKDFPENTVAYQENYVRELYERLGLEITAVTRGTWASQEHPGLGFQDAIFATKAGRADGEPALQSAPPGA